MSCFQFNIKTLQCLPYQVYRPLVQCVGYFFGFNLSTATQEITHSKVKNNDKAKVEPPDCWAMLVAMSGVKPPATALHIWYATEMPE